MLRERTFGFCLFRLIKSSVARGCRPYFTCSRTALTRESSPRIETHRIFSLSEDVLYLSHMHTCIHTAASRSNASVSGRMKAAAYQKFMSHSVSSVVGLCRSLKSCTTLRGAMSRKPMRSWSVNCPFPPFPYHSSQYTTDCKMRLTKNMNSLSLITSSPLRSAQLNIWRRTAAFFTAFCSPSKPGSIKPCAS